MLIRLGHIPQAKSGAGDYPWGAVKRCMIQTGSVSVSLVVDEYVSPTLNQFAAVPSLAPVWIVFAICGIHTRWKHDVDVQVTIRTMLVKSFIATTPHSWHVPARQGPPNYVHLMRNPASPRTSF